MLKKDIKKFREPFLLAIIAWSYPKKGVAATSMTSENNKHSLNLSAACNSRVIQQSYVLKALGLSREQIESTIRVGIGRFNTEQDILFFVKQLEKALESFEKTSATASSVLP